MKPIRLFIGASAAVFALSNPTSPVLAEDPPADPPEVTLGERLFLETRFAQFFKQFLAAGGDTNAQLPGGDPVVDETRTLTAPLPGPFAGQSMNCRSCHLVDEQVGVTGGGMRSYNDFARRSPIPERTDGALTSPRNSPPLVNASLPRAEGLLLHFDGEFASLADLIRSTYTGRNFGWLPRESADAVAHIARVIREDNGQGALAQDFGGLTYALVLAGKDPSIPPEMVLPPAFRIDVGKASDKQIFDAVAKLVAAYTEQLIFSQDEDGAFNLSPYDVFLQINDLPRMPKGNEREVDYSRRLLQAIARLESSGALQFVQSNPNTNTGEFDFHAQPFVFGAPELAGLKIFFNEAGKLPLSPSDLSAGGRGNCIACHAAPNFTDFRFHNTGTTQIEYDGLHGAGSFASLKVPTLSDRMLHHDDSLPATPQHPDATGRFRAVASHADTRLTDLGLWNVLSNPDFPRPQSRLHRLMCDLASDENRLVGLSSDSCAPASLLARSIARFKTPGLRDLGHSAPHMHDGAFDQLEDVIALYRNVSDLTRQDKLRNGAPELAGVALNTADIDPLVRFLNSLNEDYQ